MIQLNGPLPPLTTSNPAYPVLLVLGMKVKHVCAVFPWVRLEWARTLNVTSHVVVIEGGSEPVNLVVKLFKVIPVFRVVRQEQSYHIHLQKVVIVILELGLVSAHVANGVESRVPDSNAVARLSRDNVDPDARKPNPDVLVALNLGTILEVFLYGNGFVDVLPPLISAGNKLQ